MNYLVIRVGFSCRLVGQDVSCLPGVDVVGEGCGVCSGGSTGGECRAYGIRALASCKPQSQGDTLAVLCGCVNPGLLAELVQSKLERSEKPFRRCAVCQLRAVTLSAACCCFSPVSSPNSSAPGVSFAGQGVSGI